MSTSDIPYSISVQEAIISANLNSSMLLNFLLGSGIYTLTYAGTLHLYLSKKTASTHRHIVLSSITVLYLLCFANFLVQWYFLDWAFVINGDGDGSHVEAVFVAAAEGGPAWILVVVDCLFCLSFIVSDGLLIWRCYHVWGRSLRVISVPLILFVAEMGLFITVTTLTILFGGLIGASNNRISNTIESALVFVSLGTTALTTSLIGYRIHTVSRLPARSCNSNSNRSSARLPSHKLFNHLVSLVVESGAAYSLALLVYAIFAVLPTSGLLEYPGYYALYYMASVVSVSAGLAPTVLVARIAVTSTNTTISALSTAGTQGISDMHFVPPHRSSSTGATGGPGIMGCGPENHLDEVQNRNVDIESKDYVASRYSRSAGTSA